MGKLRRHAPVALALILASVSSSCGVFSGLFLRTKPLFRHGKPLTGKQTLLVATRDQLSEQIASLYNPINSFQANVNMTPSIGSVYTQIKEIPEMRALILFRKPFDIRIQAFVPLAGTQYLDMVSNAEEFRVLLNTKNLFLHGLNSAPAMSKNKVENLRPAAFLSSLLIMPAEAGVESPVLTDMTDEDNALYELHFIRKLPNGDVSIGREIWFDRLDLSIVRQMVFDDSGTIVSDTHYARWTAYNGVLFPSHIDIQRPKEGYGVSMDITSLQMNKAFTDKQFLLDKPDGATLQEIGAQPKPETTKQGTK
jgi:outer membrane lipoprotein-sorting protein